MPGRPSFSIRRPNYRRRRTFVALGLLAVVVLVVVLLTRGGGPVRPGEPPIPTVEFVAKTKAVFQGKAAAPAAQQSEVDALTKIFNEYYQTAFVDPEAWGDGTFTDLADLFTDDAKASFTRDLPALTIGQARIEVRRVDLDSTALTLTVYYDSKQQPMFAVASVSFAAKGTMKKDGSPKLTIAQAATYYLHKMGSDWKITGYDTNETQTTPTPSPTASPSS